MTQKYAQEIAANLERAEQSIQAARELTSGGYYDFAASRAYYAAFYAATAILLGKSLDLSKHSGVIAATHHQFVKTGKLDKEQGGWFIFCLKLVYTFAARKIGCSCPHYRLAINRQAEKPKPAESGLSRAVYRPFALSPTIYRRAGRWQSVNPL